MSGQQNFWARRRAGVAAEERAAQEAAEAQVHAEEQATLEENSDAELLEMFDLPDPDTLQLGDDVKAFMAKAVPDRLRRRALRALWRTNPTLANVDMLVDYGEDFTDSATVVENMQTAYQVGKGMLKHVQEMARQAEEAERRLEEALSEDEPGEPEDEDIDVPLDEPAAMALAEDAPVPTPELDVEEDEEVFAPPAPRRMKFRIEETA